MSMDLTGITNKNEYYTNHYFSTAFEENAGATISVWNAAAKESEEIRTPWSLLRQNARQYYMAHDKFVRSSVNLQVLANIKALADSYLKSLGYPEAKPEVVTVDDSLPVPVYLEMTKSNGAPLLWVLLSAPKESDAGIMESFVFRADDVDDDAAGTLYKGVLGEVANEDLVTKILFGAAEPPRFVMLIGMNQIALIDRNKWNEKRYLQFELEEIFSRLENTTLQAMSVLLHKHAFALLNGISFDDLDDGADIGGKCQSLTHGEKPIIENFSNANDEFDFILGEVKKLKNSGVALTDICVVARTKKLVDDYIALFTRAGIRSYAIKRNKADDRSYDGLRVATMHRVKGLEFKYVFIAAVNNRIIPLPSAINKTDPVSEAESITSEKCLLYVAMTRAQKGVYITSYGKKSDFLLL